MHKFSHTTCLTACPSGRVFLAKARGDAHAVKRGNLCITHSGRMKFEGALSDLRDQVKRVTCLGQPTDLPESFELWNERTVESRRSRTYRATSDEWNQLNPSHVDRVESLSPEEIFIACVGAKHWLGMDVGGFALSRRYSLATDRSQANSELRDQLFQETRFVSWLVGVRQNAEAWS